MVGAVVAMIAVVAGGVLLGVQPQLSAATAADAQRASIVADNVSKQAVLETLKSDYTQLPQLKAQLRDLERSVPSSAQMPEFIDALGALAASTHTTISSFTPSDAQPYTPPVTAPVAGAAASGTGSTGSTATPSPSPSSSATATPVPAPTAPSAPQAPPIVTNSKITPANFVAIPITIGIKGSYAKALDFVDGLQHGSRLFLVTTFASGGSSGGAGGGAGGGSSAPASWTVGGFAYVLLDPTTSTSTLTPSK
jgi:Tfp pilus assembly protein PilO